MNYKYTATANASSTHPHDWGRAMSVALQELVAQSTAGGDDIEHENLYGEDLHMTVAECEEGVRIRLSWTPKSVTGPNLVDDGRPAGRFDI